ncbi:hypothetical protein DL96DRAFT_501016 [Flagelloscypha sp. PMI_526]|nr:hypothetical protein DL96DRAFT_501016 [Flagelloscypha sp. PMI_526]
MSFIRSPLFYSHMPTPRQGTIQHREIETPVPPYSRYTAVKNFLDDWLVPISWILAFTILCAAYNIGACALGRFFLDHFHLWDRRIPSEASSLDKHAELLAALLASCLSTPIAIGLLVVFSKADDIYDRREMRFKFLNSLSSIVVFIVLTEWAFLPVSGVILHPRYQYVNPISILGVFWFGNIPLLPLSISLAWFVYLIVDKAE